jgi:hypothetical protein
VELHHFAEAINLSSDFGTAPDAGNGKATYVDNGHETLSSDRTDPDTGDVSVTGSTPTFTENDRSKATFTDHSGSASIRYGYGYGDGSGSGSGNDDHSSLSSTHTDRGTNLSYISTEGGRTLQSTPVVGVPGGGSGESFKQVLDKWTYHDRGTYTNATVGDTISNSNNLTHTDYTPGFSTLQESGTDSHGSLADGYSQNYTNDYLATDHRSDWLVVLGGVNGGFTSGSRSEVYSEGGQSTSCINSTAEERVGSSRLPRYAEGS